MVTKTTRRPWVAQEQFERETSTRAAVYYWLALKTAASRFGNDFKSQLIYWLVKFWPRKERETLIQAIFFALDGNHPRRTSKYGLEIIREIATRLEASLEKKRPRN